MLDRRGTFKIIASMNIFLCSFQQIFIQLLKNGNTGFCKTIIYNNERKFPIKPQKLKKAKKPKTQQNSNLWNRNE